MASLDKIHFDLNEFKLRLHFHHRKDPLVLHFDKPSRKFYFSLIVLIAVEIKKHGNPEYIHVRKHEELIRLLDISLAGQYASKTTDRMWEKIRTTWHYSLPDLETASHFKILDRDLLPPYEKGGKYRYDCTDEESDVWSALFETDENNKWRFKLSIDSVSLDLDNVLITMGNLKDLDAWKEFTDQLPQKKEASPNIKDSVPVHRILSAPGAAAHRVKEAKKRTQKSWRTQIAIAAGALIVIVAVIASWNFYFRGPSIEPASVEKMTYPLPEKPSIAVLAFDNLTGDPNQEYVCDGMSDAIITALARSSQLFVIARNSSFYYKGKPVKIKQVSEELSVRYVLEGSIRKQGERMRVTAQLIDAVKGYHMWSETFDREAKDIFALYDDITKIIFAQLQVHIIVGEQGTYWLKNIPLAKTNLRFWELYQKIYEVWHGNPNNIADETARGFANEMVDQWPDIGLGYAYIGLFHLYDVIFGKSRQPAESVRLAEEYAQKAIQLGARGNGLGILSLISLRIKKQHDLAIAEAQKRVEIEPNGAVAHWTLSQAYCFACQFDKAIEHGEMAIRLDPHPPAHYFSDLGSYYAGLIPYGPNHPEKAIELCTKALTMDQNGGFAAGFAHNILAQIYAYQDRIKEAQYHGSELLRIFPIYSIKYQANDWPFSDKEALQPTLELLRKAGIPEG